MSTVSVTTGCSAPAIDQAAYAPCNKDARWSIALNYSRYARVEYACGRAHLARLVESIALYGLCEFSVIALSPSAFGPEGE